MSVLKCHCGGQLDVISRLDHYLHTICSKCGVNSSDMILNNHFRKNGRKTKQARTTIHYKRRIIHDEFKNTADI